MSTTSSISIAGHKLRNVAGAGVEKICVSGDAYPSKSLHIDLHIPLRHNFSVFFHNPGRLTTVSSNTKRKISRVEMTRMYVHVFCESGKCESQRPGQSGVELIHVLYRDFEADPTHTHVMLTSQSTTFPPSTFVHAPDPPRTGRVVTATTNFAGVNSVINALHFCCICLLQD